jgi:hypothetical protein
MELTEGKMCLSANVIQVKLSDRRSHRMALDLCTWDIKLAIAIPFIVAI